MNRELLVLGCSQTKRDSKGLLPAIDRYDGSPYRVLRNYLRDREWPSNLSVAILSAKYGLVGGFTDIEDYNLRMTPARASELAPKISLTLENWAETHDNFFFSLGKDYLPAIAAASGQQSIGSTQIFEGPIGMKLSQIKSLLHRSNSPKKNRPDLPEPGSGRVSYFLPDWDDLLDDKFDFSSDSFSGSTPTERGDKHCCVLMKPKRMCDGVLVSLAQHITSKGPLRRIIGTDVQSLTPRNMRDRFGLDTGQTLFGDCGAFSYVNEEEPAITVDQAVSLYDLHGFDFGASVDHIPVTTVSRLGKKTTLSKAARSKRVETTKSNAEKFIHLVKARKASFIPVGTIQALTPEDYAETTRYYHELGFRYIALGGLVPLPDALIEIIVERVMSVVGSLSPRPWVHLFGVFRPKLQAKFRALKVDSFDSATYFRKAWLRSDQNYLSTKGKWYAALRVPMTKDGRTRKRLLQSGLDINTLEAQEAHVMNLLCTYDEGNIGVNAVLDALVEYDQSLTRSTDTRSLRATYKRTLTDRPWRDCDCPFCKDAGIHVLIFRGANRNKRRGAHNTLMLYGSLR